MRYGLLGIIIFVPKNGRNPSSVLRHEHSRWQERRTTTKRTSSGGKTASSPALETVAATDSAEAVALQLAYGDAGQARGGAKERAIVTAEGAIQ